ncbi:hypothetical protein BLSMQ_3765 [Brevibacterium aurantiacum]|uniref:Uncharacterized protein n=1 Tax=Brevibacterium aurantiacum TaxID=273384 RepID=A0A1D7W8T7_BREAU|nr:hypothetical protein BLSMQ_3765 [Brevibacterium aurantiacum]
MQTTMKRAARWAVNQAKSVPILHEIRTASMTKIRIRLPQA